MYAFGGIGEWMCQTSADPSIVAESYITHIRIIEDGAYPSSPPPPTANPNQKKPRLIIVAVRKSGRVRMHKARENANGTFSIGKTWSLDDLTAIKSFSSAVSATLEEEQQKTWAGGIGFVVTLGKPYYWQANTAKEKQFFIASLVKIFTKYTGGRSPELIGFEPREKEQLQGVSVAARPPPPSLQPGGGSAPKPSYGQEQNRPPRREPSQEPILRPQPSRDAVQRPPPPIPPVPSGSSSFTSQSSRPQIRPRRDQSPNGSMESGGSGSVQPNQPSLRRIAGTNKSQESFGRGDENSSLPPRSRGGSNGVANAPGRFPDRSVTPNSQRPVTPDSSTPGNKDALSDVPPVPAPLALPPERRRPPMPILNNSTRQRGQNMNDSIVPAPLASPGMRRDERRDDIQPPTRSSERSQPPEREINSNLANTAKAGADEAKKSEPARDIPENAVKTEPPKSSIVIPDTVAAAPPVESPSVEVPETPAEEVRPGLGPMIKKKSKGDIANAFRKAAKTQTALNSFKPRAGGAAERLREIKAKSSSEGPDGITGVVPAPSLVRGMSGDVPTAPTPVSTPPVPAEKSAERSSPRKPADVIPEVKITVPQPGRPSSVEGPVPRVQESSVVDKAKAREPRRPKPPSETMQKELASLGVEPSILSGRGSELVDLWEQFGWVGEGIRSKNIDQMQDEIERELNKAQAGGWMSRIDEEDERVAAVMKGLDKTIEECDELDGLLTLYNVELSVSYIPPTNSSI